MLYDQPLKRMHLGAQSRLFNLENGVKLIGFLSRVVAFEWTVSSGEQRRAGSDMLLQRLQSVHSFLNCGKTRSFLLKSGL